MLTKVGTIGLAAVVPETAPVFDLFVSVCLIKPDKNLVDSNFLCAFLNTPAAHIQFARALKGIGVPDLHLENIRDTLIPFPSTISLQQELVKKLMVTRRIYETKLIQAQDLLSGLDNYLLERLGINLRIEPSKVGFAVKRGTIKTRLDYDYHTPLFRQLRQLIEDGSQNVVNIRDISISIVAGFAAGRESQAFNEIDGIPHVRPFNITPFGEFTLETVKYVPRQNIDATKLLRKDDLLFNNTNSTEWVGKTSVFDGITKSTFSNHITRLALNEEVVNPYFLAALFNAFRKLGYFALLSTNFNNQAGINTQTLADLRIPLPTIKEQISIANEVQQNREKARQLRGEAASEWEAAKNRFEKALLGQEN